ncbi:MAG: DUF3343 domain-containing protein [Clostridiales bacterium]|nr:DUF3343 domain-containing protein [Clostridiales bacterium]
MSYIFSFSSRNSAMRFVDAVKDYGGAASFVNTPHLSSGCGMSVKCDDYELCQGVLNRGYYNNLTAVYVHDGGEYKSIYNADN